MNEYVIVMNAVETRLEMAQRHVRNGEKRVSRQREIIAEIALRRQSTDLAEALLIKFQNALDAHNDQLNRLS